MSHESGIYFMQSVELHAVSWNRFRFKSVFGDFCLKIEKYNVT